MNWSLIALALPFFFPGARHAEIHEFHISKCLIEYNEKEQALQVSMHLFLDDFEVALEKGGSERLFLCTEKEHEKAEQYIAAYLEEHFMLMVDGKAASLDYLGKEISEDLSAVWCYLEIPALTSLRKLAVSNDILMEIFDDQKNIVSIIGPERKKGIFLFQKGKSSDALSF